MASSSSETKRMITLRTEDKEEFEVEEEVALQWQTIKQFIEDDCANTTIPLPNVKSKILSKVIEYCKKHLPSPAEEAEVLKSFDKDFVKVDKHTLFDIIMAANYLDIKSLLNLTCQGVADMMKELDVVGVRKLFNIETDFTPEEEEEVKNENAWAFEK